MKYIISLSIGILMSLNSSFGQITFEHVYTSDVPDRSVKLSLSGLKYVSIHKVGNTITYIKLYNPDHSIFKTMNVPVWAGKNANNIRYISETLFDTDSLIEFGVNYTNTNYNSMRICNENGLVLFERDTANIAGSSVAISDDGFIPAGIFPDGGQSKLMITKGNYTGTWNWSTEIYSLPGQLACLQCDNGLVSGLLQQPGSISGQYNSLAFPNPFTDFVKIKYSLPLNFKQAFVNIFDVSGKLIKKKEIDNRYNEIYISQQELKQGAYFYQIVVDDKIISSSKMLKIGN